MPEQTDVPLDSTPSHNIKSILLLDDDIDLADTLKALLETHNFVVTTVGNGVCRGAGDHAFRFRS